MEAVPFPAVVVAAGADQAVLSVIVTVESVLRSRVADEFTREAVMVKPVELPVFTLSEVVAEDSTLGLTEPKFFDDESVRNVSDAAAPAVPQIFLVYTVLVPTWAFVPVVVESEAIVVSYAEQSVLVYPTEMVPAETERQALFA